ncbi:hypothetical protein IEQ34_017587 [Dendrobium chrysotoxum]|uniref:Uncharacterized protein n=1 Tax=Dendrobium chrysotoxum TaxID=161865 RepID=A0AAV7GBV8_DENCH|nr:hypothetical protein IEQ34_017587 [Dendrobium chrysotoxum]
MWVYFSINFDAKKKLDSLDALQRKLKEEIVKLTGLEEDECLQLHDSHALTCSHFGEIVKNILGSPLATKVIGGVLEDNLDEKHWMTVLESNLLGQNSINSILRLSYIVLPKHLQNCFAFLLHVSTRSGIW